MNTNYNHTSRPTTRPHYHLPIPWTSTSSKPNIQTTAINSTKKNIALASAVIAKRLATQCGIGVPRNRPTRCEPPEVPREGAFRHGARTEGLSTTAASTPAIEPIPTIETSHRSVVLEAASLTISRPILNNS
ncbi:hypothetical protein BofuT4_P074720.1 [Botrytis cinerea T4]|uniref:Uncharacterized protein n=1 Tax=Botryotinia fuckeliana (strain T4) TaxID=999810 RepID=G2XP64_BOTF4|nr:hypothetical protein BofuT4_P074720.1 [Botrytis cinerea T4]